MNRIVLLVAIVLLIPSISSSRQSLDAYLKPDGTTNFPPGFSGSIDARGWRMSTAPNGVPKFSQTTTANPADTAWDVNFISGDSYINGDVRAVAVIGNDVYIAGAFTSAIGATFTRIIRWDGNTWYPLGGGCNATVYALAVIGSNLYAGGDFTSPGGGVARWDSTGWHALGTGTDGTVFALGTDGVNLYAGGTFGSAGGVGAAGIAKWNGSTWSAMGSGMSATVAAIACGGGNVYAGGYFATAGGVTVNQVARWDGTWHAMAGGLDGNVRALAFSGSDLYVGGGFTMAGTVPANSIARWNGSAWDTLSAGVGGSVYSIAVRGTDLYVGGQFGTAGNVSAQNVARWNGSVWSAVGSGVNDVVWGVAVRGSGLIAGGVFRLAGADSASRAAIWNGSKWSALGSGIQFSGGGAGYIYALAADGTNLYVGGMFDRAGGVVASDIAKWNGTKWSALGSGIGRTPITTRNGDLTPYVASILLTGSTLYAGGFFASAGSTLANSVAQWNGSSWSALADGVRVIDPLNANPPGEVNDLVTNGAAFYAGGLFDSPQGNIAVWSGISWSNLGTGTDSVVLSLAFPPGHLFAGGKFVHAGGVSANRVASWGGPSPLGTGLNAPAGKLLSANGGIYAGGDFTAAGGHAANHIALWKDSTWSAVGAGMNGSSYCSICIPQVAPVTVTSLVSSNGYLFAGGYFDSAGGGQISSLAAWDGHSWSPLGSGLAKGPAYAVGSDSALPYVNCAAAAGGYLYVAGSIWNAGGKETFGLARWRIPPPERTCDLRSGWNLISAPVIASDDTVTDLFPGAASNAFAYASGAYSIQQSLTAGRGYWLKYPSSSSTTIYGVLIDNDTIPVSPGWNLVGSISTPIPVSYVTSKPPGMVTSRFFGYAGSYFTTDSLVPGTGYWVKVDTVGALILSSTHPPSANAAVRIIASADHPPLPPDGESSAPAPRLPRQFALGQNYPNPFNPVTEIAYDLPAATHVKLTIFNMLGEAVETLVDREEPPGGKSVRVDATNLASGVYFYRMEAGRFVQTRKMMVLK